LDKMAEVKAKRRSRSFDSERTPLTPHHHYD